MFNRLTALCLLTFALALPVSAQQQPGYPPGNYQPQPAPYPQQQYPQQQPYPPGAYPSPMAADPNAPQYPQPGAYPPGYPPMYGQPPVLVSSVDGALQLSLGTYFMRYTSASRDFDPELPSDESISQLAWGLGEHSPVRIEMGYGISDRLLIGGVLQLGGESLTLDPDIGVDAEASTFDLLLGPKAEFHFMPDSKFNPYAGAVLALESHSDDVYGHLLFNFIVKAGVRCFLSEGFSIDPELQFGFALGSGAAEATDGSEIDYSLSGFRIGLGLAFSGWLK